MTAAPSIHDGALRCWESIRGRMDDSVPVERIADAISRSRGAACVDRVIDDALRAMKFSDAKTLIFLSRRFDTLGEWRGTYTEIAAAMNLSRRHVSAAIARLVVSGWIEIVEREGEPFVFCPGRKFAAA